MNCIEDFGLRGKSLVVSLLVIIMLFGAGVLWAAEKVVELPEWFYELPQNGRYVYGIGISDSGIDSEIDAYLQAVDRARVMLSFCNMTKCESLTKLFKSDDLAGKMGNVSLTVRLTADLIAESSIKVEDHAVLAGGVVIVLAMLDTRAPITLLSELELEYYAHETQGEDLWVIDWNLRLNSDVAKLNFKSEYDPKSKNVRYYANKPGGSPYKDMCQLEDLENGEILVNKSIALLDGSTSSLNSAYWICFASGVSAINVYKMQAMSSEYKIGAESAAKMVAENNLYGLHVTGLDFWGKKGEQHLVMEMVSPSKVKLQEEKISWEEKLYNEFKASEAYKELQKEFEKGE
ncbi:MAG: hypothetical protein K9M99_01935 [Candidatus Cloacimonetes bacterium]|nr:hypothetical protein [Candidatus Cloacimonadota bacterium]